MKNERKEEIWTGGKREERKWKERKWTNTENRKEIEKEKENKRKGQKLSEREKILEEKEKKKRRKIFSAEMQNNQKMYEEINKYLFVKKWKNKEIRG